jgi:uncharacterized protein
MRSSSPWKPVESRFSVLTGSLAGHKSSNGALSSALCTPRLYRIYTCRNMDVQPLSYLSPKAAVHDSPIHGRGLFAIGEFGPGEIVCVKGGHILNRAMLEQVAPLLGPAEIQIGDDLFIGPVVSEEREGSMIFSNHSCDPNIGVQGQIVFVALRQIASSEELTHDWATTDDHSYSLICRCGAKSCRRTITGKDWQREDLQRKYRGFFSWYLQRKMEAGIVGSN